MQRGFLVVVLVRFHRLVRYGWFSRYGDTTAADVPANTTFARFSRIAVAGSCGCFTTLYTAPHTRFEHTIRLQRLDIAGFYLPRKPVPGPWFTTRASLVTPCRCWFCLVGSPAVQQLPDCLRLRLLQLRTHHAGRRFYRGSNLPVVGRLPCICLPTHACRLPHRRLVHTLYTTHCRGCYM